MPERFLVGVDEVGLGALAGPLVVCAVRVPVTWKPPLGLTDSKKLSHKRREELAQDLRSDFDSLSRYMEYSADDIDSMGIRNAWSEACRLAIEPLLMVKKVTKVIIDGDQNPYDFVDVEFASHTTIQVEPKADLKHPVVSAASVLAKVDRDQIMVDFDKQYPGYGFAEHKGYPTKAHKEALARLGPCPIHRRSYRPVAEAIVNKAVKFTR